VHNFSFYFSHTNCYKTMLVVQFETFTFISTNLEIKHKKKQSAKTTEI